MKRAITMPGCQGFGGSRIRLSRDRFGVHLSTKPTRPGVAFVPRTWRGFDDLFPWRLAANTEGVDGTSNAKGKKGFAGGRKRVTNQELETLQSAASELKHDLDLVYAKYKEQSLQMNTLKAEADDLRQKLAAAVKSKNGAEVATFTTLVETLRGQLETSVKAEAAAREGLARYQNEAASLKKQIEELSAEHNLLKEAQQSHQSELSALRSAAADKPRPLISLKDHLQDVSDSVEEVYELRKDLQVLAEAFKEKEVEVAVLQDALVAVEQQFQEVQAQLETAKSGEISTNQELESSLKQLSTTQAELIEAKQTISELGQRSSELEIAIRARDRVSSAVESKTSELEQSLVSFSSQIMELREELSVKEHALSEAGQKLKAGDQTASSLRSEVERLSSALKELDSQRQTWTGGSEDFQREVSQLRGEVNRLKDVEQALASATALSQQRDVEANRAKLSLEAALREKEELKVQLDGTVRALNGSKSEQQIANERNTAELKRVTQALEEALGKVEANNMQSNDATSREVARLKEALSRSDKELSAALAQEQAVGSELNSTKQALAKSQEQLEILKKDSGVQVSRIHQADEYAVAAQSALKELQAELAAECMKTQELLTKAERLVILSSFEEGEGAKGAASSDGLKYATMEAQESASKAAALEKQVEKLHDELRGLKMAQVSSVSTENFMASEAKLAAAQSETLALRERLTELSRLSRDRDRQAEEAKAALLLGYTGPKQLQELMAKVEALQAENMELKQASLRQKQLLSQTRGFLKDRAATKAQQQHRVATTEDAQLMVVG